MTSQISRSEAKRQKRLAQKAEQRSGVQKPAFDLKTISPKTDNQKKVMDLYEQDWNVVLLGCAGTGKTFISMYLALKEILSGKSPRNKLVIIRTAQASKDMGFLPGNEKQKMEVYEAPYRKICSELFDRGDAYDILKQKGLIEFQSTSFLRGTSIEDAVIIVDEIQSMRYMELVTVLTRTGNISRVLLCGDTKQDDLSSERFKEQSGLPKMLNVFSYMKTVQAVQFGIEDIIRSGFVKDFIIAEYQQGN